MAEQVKILILEDTQADVKIVEQEIKRTIKSYTLRHVETREEYLTALDKFRPDLVISDYSLHGFDGMSALKLLKARSLVIPLIIFTDSINEDTAVECIKAGAVDYVIKEKIKRLGSAILHALEQKKMGIEKTNAEKVLKESEEKYKTLFTVAQEVAHIGSWKWDIQSGKVEWTDEMFRIFGIEKKANNVNLNDIMEKSIHPDDRAKVQEVNNSVIHNKLPVSHEHRIVLPDSSIRTVWVEPGELQLDEKGRPLVLKGIVQDITERKQVEEKLEQERILLRTLIDNLPVGIYIKDRNMRKVLVNPTDLTHIGKPEEEVLGKDDNELFSPKIAAKFMADDKMVIEKGKPVINREELAVNDLGESRWLLTSKLPLRDHKGKITGLIGIGHDITERKHAEELLKEREMRLQEQNEEYQRLNEIYLAVNEELKASLKRIQMMNEDLLAAKEKAEESDKLKSAFLSNMSHEIRTPMNSIIGFSGLLTKPNIDDRNIDDEKRNKYLQIINSSCKQLLYLINDILEFSKIEAGQLTISTELTDINDVVYNLYLEYKKRIKSKEIELLFKNEGTNTSVSFLSDENRLKQILSNLLSNAIKFTHAGTIEIGYDIKGNQVEFSVRDTGIGIAPGHQELIFERFKQVETGACRQYGGAGLGLSISKSLAEMLGGSLRMESELGKGSAFFLTLPYHKAKETTGKSVMPMEVTEPVSWKGKTILIVEDEDLNYFYLSELLAETGAIELHAWNGIEAVDNIKAHPEIDLVLMDIKMPFMDGYVASLLIKKLRPELPIIALTAYALSEEKEKILQSGFANYISKPVQRDTFMEVISSHI